MVTQELIDLLVNKYRSGEDKHTINDDLLELGYAQEDINEAIRHIQKTTISQFPIINFIVRYITSMDTAISDTRSVKKGIAILGILALIMVIASIYLYDTFSIKSNNSSNNLQKSSIPVLTSSYKSYVITGAVLISQQSNKTGYPGAKVTVRDKNGHSVCQITTDSSGSFSCTVLSGGSYNVSLEIPPQYQIQNSSTITVNLPETSDTPTIFLLSPIQ